MNKISFEQLQFLIESTLNNFFDQQKDHHGWTFQEYSQACMDYALSGEMNPPERMLN